MNSLEKLNTNNDFIEIKHKEIQDIEIQKQIKTKKLFEKYKQEQQEVSQEFIESETLIKKTIIKKRNENKAIAKKLKEITTIDTYFIYNLIAKLISNMEDEEYVFIIPEIIKRNIYSGHYGYECVSNCYYGFLIIRKNLAKNIYEEEVYSNDKMPLEKQEDCILIDLITRYQIPTEISIWEMFNDNVVSQKFSYIFEFINDIVTYCEENNIDKPTKDDINNVYNSFLEKNKALARRKVK